MPHGEFIEVHAPLDEYKRYKLVGFESPSPLPAEPNANGVVDDKEKRRALFSKWFFEDRVAPATPAELAAAHGHHGEHEAIESGEIAEDAQPLTGCSEHQKGPVHQDRAFLHPCATSDARSFPRGPGLE